MEKIQLVEATQMKTDFPDLRIGDTVNVYKFNNAKVRG